jgi:hypothetical protein
MGLEWGLHLRQWWLLRLVGNRGRSLPAALAPHDREYGDG